MIDIFEKENLIIEYIDAEDCVCKYENGLFNCKFCNHIENCYTIAQSKCLDESNYVFADVINYGGYDSAEEFWNELLE